MAPRLATSVQRWLASRSSTTIQRYVMLWLCACFGIASLMIGIGLSYAIGGEHGTPVPEIFTYVAVLPGHLHTHGTVMASLGIVLFNGALYMSRRDSHVGRTMVRWSGIGVLFYSLWCTWGFAAQIATSKQWNIAPVLYLTIAFLSGAIVSLPPAIGLTSQTGGDDRA